MQSTLFSLSDHTKILSKYHYVKVLHNVILLIIFISAYLPNALADVTVEDDAGIEIRLQQPANRVVSLAPHLTELLFSAGAGDRIVATVHHSDYPLAARDIAQIGDAHNVDIETIVTLMPDLIVVWQTGNNAAIYKKLSDLGFKVYQSEPDTLEKIRTTILRLGKLAGTGTIASESSRQFQNKIELLRQQYSNKESINVFYQFWERPIYTVNGKHLISRIIELCGGKNTYFNLNSLTPQIGIESVLQSNPDIIIASGIDDRQPTWLNSWKDWPELSASRNNHLYFIPPEYIQRHTTRITLGAKMMCEYIDRARSSL